MALGGAWVVHLLGTNIVRLTGRTFSADGDASLIAPAGVAGVDVNLPAGWYGTTGGISSAVLTQNIIVLVNPVTNSSAFGLAGGTWMVEKGGDPFKITITWAGANPKAGVEPEVYVIWPHSIIQ